MIVIIILNIVFFFIMSIGLIVSGFYKRKVTKCCLENTENSLNNQNNNTNCCNKY